MTAVTYLNLGGLAELTEVCAYGKKKKKSQVNVPNQWSVFCVVSQRPKTSQGLVVPHEINRRERRAGRSCE